MRGCQYQMWVRGSLSIGRGPVQGALRLDGHPARGRDCPQDGARKGGQLGAIGSALVGDFEQEGGAIQAFLHLGGAGTWLWSMSGRHVAIAPVSMWARERPLYQPCR